MSKLIYKIKISFKQYGFKYFIIRIIKKLFSWIGIKFNLYYYLINDIDYTKQMKSWTEKGKDLNVSELIFEDFLSGDSLIFNKKKLESMKQRFAKGSYKAWGIIKNKKLIYSCWLSFNELSASNSIINESLKPHECLMTDDYCSPEYRGKGLHGSMNVYRLIKAYEAKKTKCIVIILYENKIALKSQLKVGFKKSFTYFVLTILGKSYTNFQAQSRKFAGSIVDNYE